MGDLAFSYREVVPDLQNQDKWNEIALNTGGTQSTLQDIKVAEKAGGYCFKNSSKNHTRNRFIYWRTYHDVLELSEISLDFNLYGNNVRYKFTDSPVLSVTITEQEQNFVTILVTTVSSLHRLNYPHPDIIYQNDSSETKSFSIFRDCGISTRDPSTFYVINQSTSSNNPIPHAASSYLSPNGKNAYFGLAYQSYIMLYCMNCQTGQTTFHTLQESSYIVPRIISNIKGALRGKQNSSDSEYATSLVFNHIGEQTFLIALYRDDQLRMWSTKTFQCIYSLSCLRYGNELRSQGAQANALRKVNETNVCAFLCHSMGSEFVNVKISWDGSSNYSMSRTKRISAPQSDLADFEVSENRIWALWCNAQGEFAISNFSLSPGNGAGVNWVSAAMEPPPDRFCISVEQGVDPRQAYCSYIFHPGKFDKSVITKALMMFRRTNVIFDMNLLIHVLKDRVCQAVETEIQNEIKDFDVTDDEYIDICTRYWERFYSCCEQYHIKSCQPIGLVLLNSIDGICIVKKNFFTLLRPCESLENLMITSNEENYELENYIQIQFGINEKQSKDFGRLIIILSKIENNLIDEIKLEIDKKLYQLEMPDIIISELISGTNTLEQNREIFPQDFLIYLRQNLQSINDIRTSMAILLDNLRLDLGNPAAMRTHDSLSKSTKFFLNIGNLFGSNVGLSVLSETVRQIAHIRYSLCRNLLILQQLLIDIFSICTCDVLETIRSQFMPETVVFVQSYYVMVWICETPVNLHQMVSLESTAQRLHLLHLTDGRPFFNGQNQSAPLLRIFLNSKGLYTGLSLFSERFEVTNSYWQFTLLPLANIITQLIWAVSGNFVFGEWLFSSCIHIVIQEYVRLLNSWCEWNNCSRQFILAVSLLDNGETNKAYDLFLQSIKGVQNEYFLKDKILKSSSNDDIIVDDDDDNDDDQMNDSNNLTNDEITARYYLKVIQLFEQHNALDYIILIAQAAIGILNKNDPKLPMFQSIIFNNHLILEHYEEAYHSLIYNADLSRRKDCLRQLVVSLFNKKRLDLLMHFPYTGLQDEFENIVESRARSLSIESNELYDFLYAFHVSKGNMRKASAIMYEYSMRLQLESDSLESVEKRYDCLLICINCLHLIDERFQWIAKPVISDDTTTTSAVTAANGMDVDGDIATVKEQVIVIEIPDVKKELLQVEAFLCLAHYRRDISSFMNVGPEELAIILANNGLYTSSLKLAIGFKINLIPIFESLTAACIRTVDENPNDALTWLQENDLADLPHKNNAVDMSWLLLQKLIEDYEEPNSTIIRKCVVNKILMLNAFLPQWLYSSYKYSNASELLRLFIKHDRLLEASDLAKEYIWAILGRGKEYFGLKNALVATLPAMCMPLNSIDLLLHGLRLNSDDDVENNIEYKQAMVELEELVQNYIETATRTSSDMINYKYQSLADMKTVT